MAAGAQVHVANPFSILSRVSSTMIDAFRATPIWCKLLYVGIALLFAATALIGASKRRRS